MNIVIVSKFLKAPKKLSLSEGGVIAAVSVAVVFLLGAGALAGYGGRGLIEHGPSAETTQALREQIEQQRNDLEQARADAQRELNAMSVKLAELQAQSTRLNAVGIRLTQLARLDDGEFNFDERPAVGGPDQASSLPPGQDAPTGAALGEAIDAFSQQMGLQAQQLALLESVLSDRELDASLLPTGLPVRSGYASSGFGRRSDPFTGFNEFHRGVDFSGPRGSDILSVADGVVQYAGYSNGYGNVVEIDHGNGYMTRYAHNEENLVSVGDRVKSGQVIAKMGSTGRSTGTHLHFEVWQDGKAVNPNQYLRNARG